MATIKEWLDKAGFDWENGRVIVQITEHTPGWDDPADAYEASKDGRLINKKFCDDFGGPECPRFVAEDKEKIYFPDQYDGATSLVSIYKNIEKYLDPKNPTPYPGG